MVSIDVRPTATSRLANMVLRVKPNSDFDAIWKLRALARGLVPDADLVERQTGVPLSAWQDLTPCIAWTRCPCAAANPPVLLAYRESDPPAARIRQLQAKAGVRKGLTGVQFQTSSGIRSPYNGRTIS